MPNTGRGGGVSRKITSITDRRRLKDILEDLNIPEGMGVIVRTAGAERSKAEIKRDYEYLLRLWNEIRDLTLRSTAPALIYEEGNLIKRSIRDLYTRDIDEVLVEGEEGYRTAKAFMKMLMPSHAKRVQPYREAQAASLRLQGCNIGGVELDQGIGQDEGTVHGILEFTHVAGPAVRTYERNGRS